MAVLPSGKAKVAPAIKDGGSANKYADKKGGGQVVKEEPKGETLSDGSERGNDEAGLIDPNSQFMRRWDLISIVMLVFVMFVTPFEVAYLTTSVNVLFFVNRIIDLFFISDMAIQFFLMFRDEEKGVLIKKHELIIRVYTRYFRETDNRFPPHCTPNNVHRSTGYSRSTIAAHPAALSPQMTHLAMFQGLVLDRFDCYPAVRHDRCDCEQ